MIIGISGKLYSGKDTLAKFLLKHIEEVDQGQYRYDLQSFAYKLKKMGAFLTNTPQEWWFTQEGKNKYLPDWEMTIGQFQQRLGTEAMRDGLHKDGWVISLMSEYQFYSKWIVTDVRFLNEAEAIKAKGGVIVRIEGDPTGERKKSTRDLNHPSETSLDQYPDFDYKILNITPLSYLDQQAKSIILSLHQSGKL